MSQVHSITEFLREYPEKQEKHWRLYDACADYELAKALNERRKLQPKNETFEFIPEEDMFENVK